MAKKNYERIKIYDGNTKLIYQTNEDFVLIQFFKDTINTKGKIIEIPGKGIINNTISFFIMQDLEKIGIDQHSIEKINMREQLIQLADIIPINVIVTNISHKRHKKKFGIEEGFVFNKPVIEYNLKVDEGKYEPVNENQLISFNWLDKNDLEHLKDMTFKINSYLVGFFSAIGINLVEVKLEFGRIFSPEYNSMILADEITPDSCILQEKETRKSLGYDFAMKNPSTAIWGYQEVLNRLNLSWK